MYLRGGGVQAVSYFFVLSGFVAALSGTKNRVTSLKQYLQVCKSRYCKFLTYHIPFLIASCIVFWRGFFIEDTKHAVECFILNILLLQSWVPSRDVCLSFNGVAWYLSTVLFLYCLNPFFEKIFSAINKSGFRNKWNILVIIFCCGFAIVIAILCDDKAADYFLYFYPPTRILDYLAGYAAGKIYLNRAISDSKDKKVIDFVISTTICVAYIVLLMVNIALPNSIRRQCIYIPFAVVTTYFVALNRGYIGKFFIFTMMIKLGNNTLYYFLSHQFILYCIYEIFKRLPLQNYYVGVVCMVAAFFITICSKYIVDWILKHLIRQLRKGEASRE